MTIKRKHAAITRVNYDLVELFDEKTLSDVMTMARVRITAAFHYATETYRGRKRGTDNYIIGVELRQSSLAHHINTWAYDFVRPSMLPAEIIERFTPKALAYIAKQAQFDAILATINTMCAPGNCEIWVDEAHGVWQISTSTVDEFLHARKVVKQSLKFDRRNEHGQVRSQRKARGRMAGASISHAAYPPAM